MSRSRHMSDVAAELLLSLLLLVAIFPVLGLQMAPLQNALLALGLPELRVRSIWWVSRRHGPDNDDPPSTFGVA